MSDEGLLCIRAAKESQIIQAISELYGVTLTEAADLFYRSDTSSLIEEGVSDLHCRSYKYLATIVWEEYAGKAAAAAGG